MRINKEDPPTSFGPEIIPESAEDVDNLRLYLKDVIKGSVQRGFSYDYPSWVIEWEEALGVPPMFQFESRTKVLPVLAAHAIIKWYESR